MSMSEVEALAGMLVQALAYLEGTDRASAAALVGPSRSWGLTPMSDAELVARTDVALAAVGSALHPILAEQFQAVVGRSRSLADKIEEAA